MDEEADKTAEEWAEEEAWYEAELRRINALQNDCLDLLNRIYDMRVDEKQGQLIAHADAKSRETQAAMCAAKARMGAVERQWEESKNPIAAAQMKLRINTFELQNHLDTAIDNVCAHYVKVFKEQLKAEENIPKQEIVRIEKLFMGLSKTSNPKFWRGIEDRGAKKLNVAGRGEEEIKSVIILQDNDKLPMMQGIMSQVNNAAGTFWEAGHTVFTSDELAKLTLSTRKPTKGQIAKVDAAMERALSKVKLDWTEEARGRELEVDGEPIEECILEGSLIPWRRIKMRTANGKVKTGYQLLAAPLLYVHDQSINQCTKVSVAMLEAATVPRTESNLAIRDYLLARIARAKNAKKRSRDGEGTSNRITYASLMDAAGRENDAKGKNKNATKKAAQEWLDGFKKFGHIKSWREYTSKEDAGKRGKAVTGIIINIGETK